MKIFWYNVDNMLPQKMGDSLAGFDRSADVLARTSEGFIRVAFVQYDPMGEFPPEWKIAGRNFYTFPNVRWWMPLDKLPNPERK